MAEHDLWSCPACGAEYVRDVGTCADCGGALVPGPVEEPSRQRVELCPILELDNPADIAFATSMLDSAGIAYHVRGEDVHALYGSGLAGTALFGPRRLMVDRRRADEAVGLLADLIDEDWGQAGGGGSGETGSADRSRAQRRGGSADGGGG